MPDAITILLLAVLAMLSAAILLFGYQAARSIEADEGAEADENDAPMPPANPGANLWRD